jgi:superfamily II DNA or RNA helicase
MTYRQTVGNEYEYYVLEHIRNKYEKVWHWKDFPEKIMYELNLIKDYDKFKKYRTDIGSDLVAFKDNKYYFIQCKNFNKDKIFIDTLAGFYFMLYENNLTGILYYNGNLSERLVDLSTGKIPFINLPFNNENIIFKEENATISPRNYQLEAYNKLKNLNNCILSLPCSMGKTYVSSMLGKYYDNVIILSPTRALAQQNLEKFKEYLKKEYNYILISIDGKTKIDDINKILKPKNIISSTYDSCDIVNLLITKLEKCYIIVDEFHNLSENNINDGNNQINKLINYKANKLFISATPIKGFMKINENNIYTYKWVDAITNKYICNFNIYLPNITDEIIKFLEVIKNNYNDMELKLIKKAHNLVKSMLFNGDKKCICYLTTIEKATSFNKILNLIGNTFNIDIEREQIDCNTKRLIRNEIIEKFKSSTKLFILLNVHVLDEGIDIPECDSVYITQPNNNIIKLVQRMCRANRIYKFKTECNIYLWCTEKKTQIIFDYLFDKMANFITNKIFKICNNEYAKINLKINKLNYNDNIQYIDKKNLSEKSVDFLKYFKKNNSSVLSDDLIKTYYLLSNIPFISLSEFGIWVGINRKTIIECLQKKYLIDKDFFITTCDNEKSLIILNNQNVKFKHNQKFIKITQDCFKNICIHSISNTCLKIRPHIIILEKSIQDFNILTT